jgi:hypothetical protein
VLLLHSRCNRKDKRALCDSYGHDSQNGVAVCSAAFTAGSRRNSEVGTVDCWTSLTFVFFSHVSFAQCMVFKPRSCNLWQC